MCDTLTLTGRRFTFAIDDGGTDKPAEQFPRFECARGPSTMPAHTLFNNNGSAAGLSMGDFIQTL